MFQKILIAVGSFGLGYVKGQRDAGTVENVVQELNKTEEGRAILHEFGEVLKRARNLGKDKDETKPSEAAKAAAETPTPPTVVTEPVVEPVEPGEEGPEPTAA